MAAPEVNAKRMPSKDNSIILVGAGLASAMIAHRLLAEHPDVSVTMVDEAPVPFGSHTWSFHHADVESSDLLWLKPLIACEWTSQDVRFQGFTRRLASGYASLTSETVAEQTISHPRISLVLGSAARKIEAQAVELADGRRLQASCVIDARGYRPNAAMVLGHQKFVGVEIETREPHGIAAPVIMDATVAQEDGYRFVYLLPFSANRLLIEDTRYSDGAELKDDDLRVAIEAYAAAHGWRDFTVLRTERGVLPICLAYDAERYWAEQPRDIPLAGMRAGLFHPTTGYSLPEAVRVANLVAQHWPIDSASLALRIRDHAKARAKAQGFYRFLNRMLFRAAEPGRRHLILQRFYRLPRPLIERFYAGRTTLPDMCRILIGRPPVPVHRALTCFSERSARVAS